MAANISHSVVPCTLSQKLLYCQLQELTNKGLKDFHGTGVISILISHFYPNLSQARYKRALQCCYSSKFKSLGNETILLDVDIEHVVISVKQELKSQIILNVDEHGFVLELNPSLDTFEKCLDSFSQLVKYWWTSQLLDIVNKTKKVPKIRISSMSIEKDDPSIGNPEGMTNITVKPCIKFKISGDADKDAILKEFQATIGKFFIQWRLTKEFEANLNDEDVECVGGVCEALR